MHPEWGNLGLKADNGSRVDAVMLKAQLVAELQFLRETVVPLFFLTSPTKWSPRLEGL